MKRLLLASASPGIRALSELVPVPAGLRFAFVPTAAGPEAESRETVQNDRRELEALGCDVSILELTTASRAEVEGALTAADGVFVTGGNRYLLLWHARRSGFAELVVPRIEAGTLLYAGTSAGAMLATPDVDPPASVEGRAAAPELDSTAALGLVDFRVLPHADDPERVAWHDAAVANHPEYEFVRLNDNQAIVVRGAAWEVVTVS